MEQRELAGGFHLVSGRGGQILQRAGGAGMLLTFLVVGVAVLAMRRPAVRERVRTAVIWTLARVQRLIRRPAGDPAGIIADMMADLAARLNRGDLIRAVVSAVRNWTFDLFCLVFSIKAAGVHVPWWGIILAWAAGTGGASLNLTPGGLGVVEAASRLSHRDFTKISLNLVAFPLA